MSNSIVKKKFIKTYDNQIEKYSTYYKILMDINNIKLKPMEISLLAFLNIYGTVSTVNTKEKFITLFRTTENSLSAYTTMLYKKKLIEKFNGKVQLKKSLQVKDNVIISILLTDSIKQLGYNDTTEDIEKEGDVEKEKKEKTPII